MKKLRLILALLTVLCVVLSGCGEAAGQNGGEAAAPGASEDEASAPGSGDTLPLGEGAYFAPYDPPITIKSWMSTIDATVQLTENQTGEDNVWTRLFRDKLGINLEYTFVADASQGKEKMNLAIASGELPDIFWVDKTQFEQLLINDKLEELTASYDEYAGSYITESKKIEGAQKGFDVCSKNGKLYAVPYFNNHTQETINIWIRKDWLDKANLPVPKTMEELTDTARVFMEQDFDGAGQTYGFSIEKVSFDLRNSMTGFFNGYHAYPGIYVRDENGGIVAGEAQAEPMKNALTQLNALYNEGVIAKNFTTSEFGSTCVEDLMAGKVGIRFGGLWDGWWPLGDMKAANPEVEWISIPAVSCDDKPAKVQSSPISMYRLHAVRKGFEHPEALFKMLNVANKLLWESDAETFAEYGYNASGNNPWNLSPVYFENLEKNRVLYHHTSKAIETGDTALFNGEDALIYGWMKDYLDGDLSRYGIYLSYGPDSACAKMDYYTDNNLYMLNEFYGSATPAMLEKDAILSKSYTETVTKIITGELPVEAYDQFVTDYFEQGGAQIAKEVDEWTKNVG